MKGKKILDLRCWIMNLDYEYNLEIFVDADEHGGRKFIKYAWPFDGREPEIMKEVSEEEVEEMIETLMKFCEVRKGCQKKIRQEWGKVKNEIKGLNNL